MHVLQDLLAVSMAALADGAVCLFAVFLALQTSSSLHIYSIFCLV